jgi:hypothetical protein
MKIRNLFAVILTAFALPAVAGEPGALSASPAVVMLRGAAGQSTTQTLTIVNGTSQEFACDMVAKDIVVRDGKRVFVRAGELPGSIAATAVFSRGKLLVEPGARAVVDVTLTIPSQPSVRGVVVLFQGTGKLKSGHMNVVASLGTLLTFAISEHVSANVSPLIVQLPTVTSNLAVEQQMTNSGSEPLFAKGMLAVVDGAGALMAKEAIAGRRLLPGERAAMRASYGGELPPGHYRALVTYDLQNDKPLTSTAEFDVR